MMEDGKALADDIDRALGDITRTERPDFDFDQRSGAREVMESLGVMNLEGFGISLEHPGLGPAGAVLVYAQDVLKGKPGNLNRVEEYRSGQALLLDPATQRNLEVFRTSAQTRKGSLLDCIDQLLVPEVPVWSRVFLPDQNVILPKLDGGRPVWKNFPVVLLRWKISGKSYEGVRIWSAFLAVCATV